MQSTKISQEELETENKVFNLIKESGKAVSIGYVASSLGVYWGRAQNILFKLSWKGKIIAQETTQGFFFSLKSTNN
jgi:hypothetical protein